MKTFFNQTKQHKRISSFLGNLIKLNQNKIKVRVNKQRR